MLSLDWIDTIALDASAELPLQMQLAQALRDRIVSGKMASGTRLPTHRELAARLGVARITVTEAYRQLQAEGLVEARVGAGTFVVDLPPISAESQPHSPRLSPWGQRVLAASTPSHKQATARPEIDFGFGRSYPHIFPYDIWRKLLARYLSTDDAMLSRYGSVAGFEPLRQALADHLTRVRGVVCSAEQVVIVSGAQQALDLLARLLLTPGDRVLVETPGYRDAFKLFKLYGAHLLGAQVDTAGLPVEQLKPSLRPRLIFTTPSNQFPRGGSLSIQRRLALLQWARERQALIVEDDYDGELRYDSHPLPALQSLDRDERVIYLGTFSKVLFPALRLGYVVLPPALVAPFVAAKGLVDRGAPTLTQAAIADFIAEGHFERHLRHLRVAYGERRQALVKALDAHWGDAVDYTNVPAGLHVMVYLNSAENEPDLIRRAAAEGVGIYPGAPYHLQQPAPPSILLGFSGLTAEEIEQGIARLAPLLNTA